MATLSPHFALFNQTINNADSRALKILEEHFPPAWAAEIRTFQADGIMGIFEQEAPTPATAAYVALVTAFVNENEGG